MTYLVLDRRAFCRQRPSSPAAAKSETPLISSTHLSIVPGLLLACQKELTPIDLVKHELLKLLLTSSYYSLCRAAGSSCFAGARRSSTEPRGLYACSSGGLHARAEDVLITFEFFPPWPEDEVGNLPGMKLLCTCLRETSKETRWRE